MPVFEEPSLFLKTDPEDLIRVATALHERYGEGMTFEGLIGHYNDAQSNPLPFVTLPFNTDLTLAYLFYAELHLLGHEPSPFRHALAQVLAECEGDLERFKAEALLVLQDEGDFTSEDKARLQDAIHASSEKSAQACYDALQPLILQAYIHKRQYQTRIDCHRGLIFNGAKFMAEPGESDENFMARLMRYMLDEMGLDETLAQFLTEYSNQRYFQGASKNPHHWLLNAVVTLRESNRRFEIIPIDQNTARVRVTGYYYDFQQGVLPPRVPTGEEAPRYVFDRGIPAYTIAEYDCTLRDPQSRVRFTKSAYADSAGAPVKVTEVRNDFYIYDPKLRTRLYKFQLQHFIVPKILRRESLLRTERTFINNYLEARFLNAAGQLRLNTLSRFYDTYLHTPVSPEANAENDSEFSLSKVAYDQIDCFLLAFRRHSFLRTLLKNSAAFVTLLGESPHYLDVLVTRYPYDESLKLMQQLSLLLQTDEPDWEFINFQLARFPACSYDLSLIFACAVKRKGKALFDKLVKQPDIVNRLSQACLYELAAQSQTYFEFILSHQKNLLGQGVSQKNATGFAQRFQTTQALKLLWLYFETRETLIQKMPSSLYPWAANLTLDTPLDLFVLAAEHGKKNNKASKTRILEKFVNASLLDVKWCQAVRETMTPEARRAFQQDGLPGLQHLHRHQAEQARLRGTYYTEPHAPLSVEDEAPATLAAPVETEASHTGLLELLDLSSSQALLDYALSDDTHPDDLLNYFINLAQQPLAEQNQKCLKTTVDHSTRLIECFVAHASLSLIFQYLALRTAHQRAQGDFYDYGLEAWEGAFQRLYEAECHGDDLAVQAAYLALNALPPRVRMDNVEGLHVQKCNNLGALFVKIAAVNDHVLTERTPYFNNAVIQAIKHGDFYPRHALDVLLAPGAHAEPDANGQYSPTAAYVSNPVRDLFLTDEQAPKRIQRLLADTSYFKHKVQSRPSQLATLFYLEYQAGGQRSPLIVGLMRSPVIDRLIDGAPGDMLHYMLSVQYRDSDALIEHLEKYFIERVHVREKILACDPLYQYLVYYACAKGKLAQIAMLDEPTLHALMRLPKFKLANLYANESANTGNDSVNALYRILILALRVLRTTQYDTTPPLSFIRDLHAHLMGTETCFTHEVNPAYRLALFIEMLKAMDNQELRPHFQRTLAQFFILTEAQGQGRALLHFFQGNDRDALMTFFKYLAKHFFSPQSREYQLTFLIGDRILGHVEEGLTPSLFIYLTQALFKGTFSETLMPFENLFLPLNGHTKERHQLSQLMSREGYIRWGMSDVETPRDAYKQFSHGINLSPSEAERQLRKLANEHQQSLLSTALTYPEYIAVLSFETLEALFEACLQIKDHKRLSRQLSLIATYALGSAPTYSFMGQGQAGDHPILRLLILTLRFGRACDEVPARLPGLIELLHQKFNVQYEHIPSYSMSDMLKLMTVLMVLINENKLTQLFPTSHEEMTRFVNLRLGFAGRWLATALPSDPAQTTGVTDALAFYDALTVYCQGHGLNVNSITPINYPLFFKALSQDDFETHLSGINFSDPEQGRKQFVEIARWINQDTYKIQALLKAIGHHANVYSRGWSNRSLRASANDLAESLPSFMLARIKEDSPGLSELVQDRVSFGGSLRSITPTLSRAITPRSTRTSGRTTPTPQSNPSTQTRANRL